MASCSSESELADNGASDALTSTQWSHQIANSNVEIKFGSKIKGTRAIVESDDQQNFTLTNMGLFCLAIAKNNINPNEANIDYTQGSAGYKPKSLSMLISKCFDHYFQFMLRFYIQG